MLFALYISKIDKRVHVKSKTSWACVDRVTENIGDDKNTAVESNIFFCFSSS